MKRASLLVLFACAYLPSTARAQVQTGTPPLGTFSGVPDIVDVANLNSHVTIPVLSKQGRGIPFVFYITEDSSVWNPVTSGATKVWQPVTGWGWNQSAGNIGAVTSQMLIHNQLEPCGDLEVEKMTTSWTNWTYTDGFHTSHPFAISTSSTYDPCTDNTTTTSAQGTATDASGYTLSINGGSVTLLTDAAGSVINPRTGAGSLQDRNGNLISLSSNGIITDTLGKRQ